MHRPEFVGQDWPRKPVQSQRQTLQAMQRGLNHNAADLQDAQEIVGGGVQNSSGTDTVKVAVADDSLAMFLGLRLAAGAKIIHDVLPSSFCDIGIVCGKVGFGKGHAQNRELSGSFTNREQALGFAAVAGMETRFSVGLRILKIKDAIAMQEPELIFHWESRSWR